MTALTSSLKATRHGETEDDPIAGLKRAQADYQAAKTGFRNRQRQILQDVYRSVSDLLDDDEACHKFMKRGPVAKFAGHDGDPSTNADRGDVWFHALAFVYQAKSRESCKRASKHASALRLLYAEDVDADQIAETIERLEALGEQFDGDSARRRQRVHDRPIAGTRLIREWQGVEHCVTVLRDGFEWQGRPYKSLSAVARAGTRWNGLIFFAIKNQRGRP